MFAVVSVLAQGAETQVATARELDTGPTVLAGIVLAHGYLAGGSHIAGGAFALPLLRLLAVLVYLIGFDFDAGGAIATGTR